MAIAYATTLRNDKLNAITTAVDAGAGAGKIRIYAGTRPATGGAVTTLLAELAMSDPSFPVAVSGVLTAAVDSISDDTSADATGVASWFRIVDSADNFVLDGSAGTSGTDMILSSASIQAGVVVSVTSIVITAGNA